MGTYEINKLLSCFDDKRFVLDDGIDTLAYFHKDLKNPRQKRFSQMITNKFSMIVGLIGVRVSSIANGGCQDNFKPVFFRLQKGFERTKSTKTQNK